MKKLYEYTIPQIVEHCHGMPFGEGYVISDEVFYEYDSAILKYQIPVTTINTKIPSRWGSGESAEELYNYLKKQGLTTCVEALELKLYQELTQKRIYLTRLELVLGANEI